MECVYHMILRELLFIFLDVNIALWLSESVLS